MKLLLFVPVLLFAAGMAASAADKAKDAQVLGEWKFDEGTGTNAVDSSGHGYDGTIIGAQYVKTKLGYCLKFNGKDNYVQYILALKTPLNQGAFEAWASPDLDGYWLSKALGGGRRGEVINTGYIFIDLTGDCWQAITLGTPGLFNIKGPQAADKQWTHLAFTWSADNIAYFYVNGQEIEGTIPMRYPFPLGGQKKVLPFNVGSQSPRYANMLPFNGLIDDVRLYDRNLTAAEIQSHYQDGLNRR